MIKPQWARLGTLVLRQHPGIKTIRRPVTHSSGPPNGGRRRQGALWPIQMVCVCKVARVQAVFVSVGVGPLYRALGSRFAKSALGLANFRSYREISFLEYLKSIGFAATNDRAYPDLA